MKRKNTSSKDTDYNQIDFVDMNHTLEWLLETASKYRCKNSIAHLKAAQDSINQRKRILFREE